MLYLTTRNDRDTFTAARTLKEFRGPDGGFYTPFHAPRFSGEELNVLLSKSFGQCVADILNRLFPVNLTGWDVDFCIGRNAVRLQPLGHRVTVAETWHNPDWNFDRVVKNLYKMLSDSAVEMPSEWTEIAVRIAVLFGIVAQLRQGEPAQVYDIALVSGNFIAPMSAWYARQWGLPIGNIVCCCNENNSIWELLGNGQMRTDGVSISTVTPDADIVVPESLERLIYECGGAAESSRYQDCCRVGRAYAPDDAVLAKMRKGLYVSVVGAQRIQRTILSVYRSFGRILSPYDALVYCGLQDYRARFGEVKPALIFCQKSPLMDAAAVAAALEITVDDLQKLV